MTENLNQYRRALEAFDKLIRSVPEGAWDNPSPCTEWTARDVARHVTGVQCLLLGALTGRPTVTGGGAAGSGDGADVAAAWERAQADVLDAAASPGALDAVIPTPFGEMPADTFVGLLVADALTHAWDLGRAVGVPVSLDADLVGAVRDRLTPLDATLRASGAFAPPVTPPDGADEQTALMAFLGRDVHTWR